jgi:hypothetical protein
MKTTPPTTPEKNEEKNKHMPPQGIKVKYNAFLLSSQVLLIQS